MLHPIRSTPRYQAALRATHDLLGKLRIEAAFVGGVARSAWLGTELASGSIDVLALMQPQQKNQVAMMGSNRGFAVSREEIEQSEELDLVPLSHDGIRVHVLLASNALYGRMVAAAIPAEMDEITVRVPAAEDFALLLMMSEDEEGVGALMALPNFDRDAFNKMLRSIGLGNLVSS